MSDQTVEQKLNRMMELTEAMVQADADAVTRVLHHFAGVSSRHYLTPLLPLSPVVTFYAYRTVEISDLLTEAFMLLGLPRLAWYHKHLPEAGHAELLTLVIHKEQTANRPDPDQAWLAEIMKEEKPLVRLKTWLNLCLANEPECFRDLFEALFWCNDRLGEVLGLEKRYGTYNNYGQIGLSHILNAYLQVVGEEPLRLIWKREGDGNGRPLLVGVRTASQTFGEPWSPDYVD